MIDKKTLEILTNIKIKIGYTDILQARDATTRILFVFRELVNRKDLEKFSSDLPDGLLLILFSAWKKKVITPKIEHIDDFVHQAMRIDRQFEKRVFNHEIETLRAVLVVVNEIQKNTEMLAYMSLKLSHEFKRILINYAA